MNSIAANKNFSFVFVSSVTLFVAFPITGCRPEEPIRQIQVVKDRSGLSSLKPVEPQSGVPRKEKASSTTASRMVVAIAQKEKATWFYKILGPVESVAASEDQWRSFFEKANFDEAGNPKFDLPEGWTETPSGQMMRYSTVKFPAGDESLDIAVSSLAPNQDLLSNVNRWRGQLGLQPVTKETMKLQTVDSAGGKLIIYDDIGKFGGGMMPSPQTAAPKEPQLKYTAPDGWTEGRTSQIVRVRLLKQADDQKIQLSVTEMPAAVNKWKPNVDRWLGELELVADEHAEFAASNETKLTVSGIEAQRVRLVTDDETTKRATIAIMLKRNDSAWFIKLNGPRQMVADHEKDFDAFVDSFKFK